MTKKVDINDHAATAARRDEFTKDVGGRPVRGNALLKLEATISNVYGMLGNAQPNRATSPNQTAEEVREFYLGLATAHADAAMLLLTELLEEMRNVKERIANEA